MFCQLRQRLSAAMLLAVCASLGLACAHSKQSTTPLTKDVLYPPWVLAGTGAQESGGQRALIGVGQIDGMRNIALARATADNRARAEVARVLTVFLAALSAQAQAARPPSSASPTSDDELRKIMLAAVLPAVQVVDHWFHPDRGAVFSLARLELEDVHDALGRARELPEGLVSGLLAGLQSVHAAMLTASPHRQADASAQPTPNSPQVR